MDEPDYTRVAGFASQRQAVAAAQELIVGGIGSTIEAAPLTPEPSLTPEPQPPSPAFRPGAEVEPGPVESEGQRFWVLVVPGDRARACELLGLVDDVAATDLDRVRAGVPPMRYLVVAALVAFVAIPLLAFFITFKLAGG